ncbi:MAG: MmcQ/YjbR family DNA-binding protein [Pirellulales bacterium]
MTEDAFRRLVLSLPATEERAHQGHPDFRVGGKIFASLGYPEKGWGMVKLTPAAQRDHVAAEPEVFVPVRGAWGRQGNTNVQLKKATKAKLLPAVIAAWRNVAPKKLVAEFDE